MMKVRGPAVVLTSSVCCYYGMVLSVVSSSSLTLVAAATTTGRHARRLVSFHGHSSLRRHRRRNNSAAAAATGTTTTASEESSSSSSNHHNENHHRFSERTHTMLSAERPADPRTLITTPEELQVHVEKLYHWWQHEQGGNNNNNVKSSANTKKKQVLCLTGAGLSTESGIPDYRGHGGSYHNTGHKPMVHDQFMNSSLQRQRYWGRGMVGWRFFNEKKPAAGHFALATLERNGMLGVTFDDRPDFYSDDDEDDDANTVSVGGGGGDGSGQQQQQQRQLSIVTQNVDTLHRRAGTRHVMELHGRTDRLTCMQCGHVCDRASFHDELEAVNTEWLRAAAQASTASKDDEAASNMRPDGDAAVATNTNYQDVTVPACRRCGDGCFKPDVVFFGDTVPAHRVQQCHAAVAACDGLLVVGSSLAVHSAYRHVRAAHQRGTPICILNVGETRAEIEGLNNVLKIEAPAGPTLDGLVRLLALKKTISTAT